MGIPEGHALAHQVIGGVGGVGKAALRAVSHPGLVEFHGPEHSGHQADAVKNGVDGVKGAFLILLHIFIIG